MLLEDKEKIINSLIHAMEVMDPAFRQYKGANKWIDPAIQYLRKQQNL